MAKTPSAHPDQLLLYERLIATNPALQRQGATVPYTAVNGHMFSYLSKQGKLELRLPAPEREAFLRQYDTKLCQAYGVVQAEYVEVPDTLLANTLELKAFFDLSFTYARSLKPKLAANKKAKPAVKHL